MRNKTLEDKIIKLLKSPIDGDVLLGNEILKRQYGRNIPRFLMDEKITISRRKGWLIVAWPQAGYGCLISKEIKMS